jgi:uncharacterized membrane protein YhaH (DUF805 family)
MRQQSWKWLFTWEGRVPRQRYLLTGSILVALKYAIDSLVAAHFGERWLIWNYFRPSLDASLFGLGLRQPKLYGILLAISIPFFWVGIALTLRRLQDAGKHAGWVFLFFLPPANLALFFWLALAPSAPTAIDRNIPTDDLRKATHGLALATILGLSLVALSTRVLGGYGWGLFLGVPFLIGFVSSWFLNVETPHSRFDTITVSTLTIFLVGLALIGLRVEGLICLLMALPLAFPFSIAGGLVARYILYCRYRPSAPPTLAACVVILPLAMFAEHEVKFDPPVNAVTTNITIDAPVSVVWKNVVAFPPLAPPGEWLFRAGVAYPTSAQIVGSGPGAMRYCRFSTGDFVEPITVWDENRLLAFDVSAQPQAMRELSPWKITPPHLERHYMRSRHGQFRLVALSDHRTLLEGTTWYQNYFWPQAYWREWSDLIVHRIHMRVLRHVKEKAEAR